MIAKTARGGPFHLKKISTSFKKDYARPAARATEHPEKQVGHEKGTLANPNAGALETGKDPKNVATPKSGVHDEHKKKIGFDDRHDEAERKRL
jgi:hypothetical protein